MNERKLNPQNSIGTIPVLSKELFDLDAEEKEYNEDIKNTDYSKNKVATPDFLTEIHKEIMRKERLWNLFVSTFRNNIYLPKDPNNVEVLDIACSHCFEGETLNAFLSGNGEDKFRYDTPKVKIFGIDVDSEAIEQAKEEYKGKDNYIFYDGSAEDLNQYPDLPEKFDFVILRGQQMFNRSSRLYKNEGNKKVWGDIIKSAMDRMHEGSIFMITSFTEQEYLDLVDFLEEEEMNIVEKKKNKYSEKIKEGNGGDDMYIVVLKKIK